MTQSTDDASPQVDHRLGVGAFMTYFIYLLIITLIPTAGGFIGWFLFVYWSLM